MNATRTIEAEGQSCTACIGFDQLGRPREIFLTAGKEGSALAKSVGRLPGVPVGPRDLDKPARQPASLIGTALDLLREFEG